MSHKQAVKADVFTRKAVMKILHIMRNLRNPVMDMDFEIELSYPQMLMMYVLLETGPATMGQLADWLKISHGVATRTMDSLVAKGVAERERGEQDRRVVHVSLSSAGREYAETIITYHLEKLNEVFSTVSQQEKDSFLSLLDEIDKQLEE
jgi:DNA-binding MarR family transcriptional regulator